MLPPMFLKRTGILKSNEANYGQMSTEEDKPMVDAEGVTRLKEQKTYTDETCKGRCLNYLCCRCSKRYYIAWLSSFGFMITFGIRCNMSWAMLSMIGRHNESMHAHNHHKTHELINKGHVVDLGGILNVTTKPDFYWTAGERGLVDSSFFYGYLITQIPGGVIAAIFPANKLFGVAVGGSAVLNLLLPSACTAHYGLVMAIRVLQGLVESNKNAYLPAVLLLRKAVHLAKLGKKHAVYLSPLAECSNNTGFLSAVPHLVMAIIVPLGGQLADRLRKNMLSTTAVRKIFNCGGFGLEAVFLLGVGYSKTITSALACLILAVGFSGFAISGYNVNHLDIAPRYASILMGLSNGVGTISGMICPLTTELLTKGEQKDGWAIVFLIASLVHFAGVTFYALFASGEKQPWAETPDEALSNWQPPTDLPAEVRAADYGYMGGDIPQPRKRSATGQPLSEMPDPSYHTTGRQPTYSTQQQPYGYGYNQTVADCQTNGVQDDPYHHGY
ncbi:MFS transporter, ACS family, solute carrier family 17, member 6/7/8 [Paragonimus westermani]|uniref:MFS transporter, ACS family, solute carrier family 17, member 6/7/8 n=1 Tax=Paragonimus westermani TaxID=34504 RepID=A0A5J4P2I9_9TREM|nr:MFS transporter, ACS family, solute carrier family 17, member 6/7/8 [Paragonimus westermani]